MIALAVAAFFASFGRPQAIGPIQFSVSAIVQLAAIPLTGAVGAALVSVVPSLTERNEAVKKIFNVAQRVLLVLAGSLAYSAVGGVGLRPALVDIDLVALALTMVVATAGAALMNTALLAGVLQRDSGGSLDFIIRNVTLRVVSSYATSFVAAYILVVLWSPARLGWISALFFLPSIVVIQWSLRQLAGEWAVRRDVLAPFVTALDTRRPGAGESSRLAAGAASAIAAAVGLRPSFVDKVVMAARLRDVGLLALEDKPPAIIRRDHAVASASVLGEVSFLDGSLTYIAGHHERVDGQGRPDGLVGAQIPLGSRVLAVADAWSDAVTDGCSAEEAVRLCEDRVGTHLDEVCVNALRRAHGRGQLPAVGR
ncbi:HD domain-containing phosphohydrolase [Janibacter sp. DB-40]|uniref:HD-GYP domain-containing protein n=1 Tax=Janibacter sp. DB-40 TaxID=3028808 RepID=UPI002406F3BC|nr:HD domain-containing phosphohydrolase [Janibacter sp. DB-40]